jgi:agmatinase
MIQKKINWMNLPDEYASDDSKFVILPIAYEKHLTYGDGASQGSFAIIDASRHLEYYDDQFESEPFLEGIKLFEPLRLTDESPEDMVQLVSNKVKSAISAGVDGTGNNGAGNDGQQKIENKDKFIIGLGGDHAVTIGMVKGLEEAYLGGENEGFSVIQFDAHSDFRDSWKNSQFNHACTAKQISKNHSLALLGVRSMDIDEEKEIKNNETVHLVKIYDFSLEKLETILPKLNDKVFITIDVDVFDPSFIRNTGTPEPDGLFWKDLMSVLKLIFMKKTVIGADIVEFAPKFNFEAEAYSLAKLVYKIMALKSLSTQDKESL